MENEHRKTAPTTEAASYRKRTRKKGGVFIAAGLLLIAAALSLVAYNIVSERNAAMQSAHIAQVLTDKSDGLSGGSDGIPQEPNRAPSEEAEIPDYILNPQMDMPVVTVDQNGYIGVLEIPSLELILPVMDSWSYGKLNIAPCRYSGSAYTDDLVIAAHNYACHFARLPLLAENDELSFTDASGNTFTYRVVLTETVAANAVQDMTESVFDLTLFTCNRTGLARIAVRCNRTDG